MLVRYAPPGDSAELVTLDDPDAPFLAELEFPVHALGSSKPGSKKTAWGSNYHSGGEILRGCSS
jgi:hypothetical protein